MELPEKAKAEIFHFSCEMKSLVPISLTVPKVKSFMGTVNVPATSEINTVTYSHFPFDQSAKF